MSQNRTKPALLTAGKPKKVKIPIYPHVLKKRKVKSWKSNKIKNTVVTQAAKTQKLESKTAKKNYKKRVKKEKKKKRRRENGTNQGSLGFEQAEGEGVVAVFVTVRERKEID